MKKVEILDEELPEIIIDPVGPYLSDLEKLQRFCDKIVGLYRKYEHEETQSCKTRRNLKSLNFIKLVQDGTIVLSDNAFQFNVEEITKKRHIVRSGQLDSNGKLNGVGMKFDVEECEVQEGQFLNDNMDKYCMCTYPNGEYYLGEYKGNQKNGKGKFVFVSGSQYVGEYKNNLQHG